MSCPDGLQQGLGREHLKTCQVCPRHPMWELFAPPNPPLPQNEIGLSPPQGIGARR